MVSFIPFRAFLSLEGKIDGIINLKLIEFFLSFVSRELAELYTSLLIAQQELNQLSTTWGSHGQETESFVLKILIRDHWTMIEEDGMNFN